jgi:hypothetical protein
MKRCAQCQGKLGLGVRSRKVWNGRWGVHVGYCSAHCVLFMTMPEPKVVGTP